MKIARGLTKHATSWLGSKSNPRPLALKASAEVCGCVREVVQLDRCCGRGCGSRVLWVVVATRLLHNRELADHLTLSRSLTVRHLSWPVAQRLNRAVQLRRGRDGGVL
jgi:hypothetical protein